MLEPDAVDVTLPVVFDAVAVLAFVRAAAVASFLSSAGRLRTRSRGYRSRATGGAPRGRSSDSGGSHRCGKSEIAPVETTAMGVRHAFASAAVRVDVRSATAVSSPPTMFGEVFASAVAPVAKTHCACGPSGGDGNANISAAAAPNRSSAPMTSYAAAAATAAERRGSAQGQYNGADWGREADDGPLLREREYCCFCCCCCCDRGAG
mgnify:CR=1 FL=1